MSVLGNSTDYWPVVEPGRSTPSPAAWPGLLEERLVDRFGPQVTVDNRSLRGAGHDVGYLGTPSLRDGLAELVAESPAGQRVVVLAPSVIDLQLKDHDVDRSVAAFEELVTVAEREFDTVLVLPMNPVGPRWVDADLPGAIAAFDEHLAALSRLDPAYPASPLLDGSGLFGAARFYDDFDDMRADEHPHPDDLHPDADGHVAVADALAPWVGDVIDAMCRGSTG